jgi:hypothetical protein
MCQAVGSHVLMPILLPGSGASLVLFPAHSRAFVIQNRLVRARTRMMAVGDDHHDCSHLT